MEHAESDEEHLQKVEHFTIPNRTRGGGKVNIRKILI